MKQLLPLFFLLVVPVSAQDVLTDSAYQRLETEVQSVDQPLTRLVANAYIVLDEAIETRRFQRADSLIALVTAHVVAERKPTDTAIFLPGLTEHVALGLLSGEPSTLHLLRDDDVWWKPRLEGTPAFLFPRYDNPAVVFLHDGRYNELGRRHSFASQISLRQSFLSALTEDRDSLLEKLAAAGATPEQQAIIPLVIAVFLQTENLFYWHPQPDLSSQQERLNEDADRFLLAYPATRYGRFVREHVRKRYRPGPALGGAVALGGGSAEGGLGNRFAGGISFEFSVDWRDRNYHVGLTLQGAEQRVRDRFVVGKDVAELDEIYHTIFAGLEGGPRVQLGPLDIQPYLAGGIVRFIPRKNGDGEIEHGSTWDPGSRLSYGYGLKTDLSLFSLGTNKWALRARIGRVVPRLGVRDGVDLGGPVSFFTIGISARVQQYVRVD